jgi:PEP-CTERM motif
MRLTNSLFAAILLAASTLSASASPITYTDTFTGSGVLGGVSFTNQLVTLTGIGDTTGMTFSEDDYFNAITATIQIGSGSVDAFTDSMEVIDDQTASLAEFADATTGGEIVSATSAPVFGTYELQDAVSGTGDSAFAPGLPFPTALGTLTLTSVSENGTFTATLPPAVTPEPSTLMLLATGLLGAAGALRRRFAA